MRNLVLLPLMGAFLAAGAMAQGNVVPPHLNKFGKDPIFNAPTIPGTTFSQINMIPYPGQPGKFIVGITVASGLPTANGGVGGADFLMGVYDAAKKQFTPDKNAAFLNSGKSEFGLTFHHSGLYAYMESDGAGTYSPYLVSRKSLNAPFSVVGVIKGLPMAQGWWDGSLADIGGQMHIIYVLNHNLVASPLTISGGTVTAGNPVTLVNTPVANVDANSPTPITTTKGELVALSHHVNVNANDHWLSFDLDPKTPALSFISLADWINNGGYIAGTFYDGHSASSGYQISSVQSVWWTGGKAKIGTNMEISAYIPVQGTGATPWVSYFLISDGFLASPLTIPGITGKFGLNPGYLVPVTIGAHNPLTGQAMITLPIPNNAALSGYTVPGQSLTIDPKTQKLYLGNTAALTIL